MPKAKSCSKCKKRKSLANFTQRKLPSGNTSWSSWCRGCSTKYKKTWDSKRKLELREYVFNYLLTHKCVVCGCSDMLVLEFDHKDPSTKLFNVGKASSGKHDKGKDERRVTLKSLIKEIDKCEVMCRNCHQRKTHRDTNSWRWRIASSKNPKEFSLG